jgi:hypothetical protein
MASVFSKGCLSGTLQLQTIDHCIRDRGRIRWTTKQVLMLADADGRPLSSAEFRPNATRKARDFFVSQGWIVTG